MSPKLIKRIASAAILAPVFLAFLIWGGVPLIIWLGLAFILSAYEWWGLSRKTTFIVPCMILGILYMAAAFASFYILRESYSIYTILLFLIMIWSSDIGAYFTGKTIGGPKLIPSVSPNKTWSGYAGALMFPVLVAMIWLYGFGGVSATLDGFNVLQTIMAAIGLGTITGASGQAGDLLVSFIKRKANVKDTGHLIPGHGGILDRIDSLLLGAPIFLGMMVCIEYVF